MDHFLAHLVVPRDVLLPVPKSRLKSLIRLADRPLTNCATDAGCLA
jgi:hypothetical protein